MSESWYALRSKPRKEEVLWKQLLAREIEVFYPRVRVHPVNPRSRKLRPYFPGYMFVHADLEEMGQSQFNWMPFAIGLVSFDGVPASVPENLIYEIRKRVDEIAAAGGEFYDGLKSGEPVRISSGPFAGYEAIFDMRLPGSERVRVLIQMLTDRNVPVELKAGQVERKKKN
ncbi:MAG: transcription termination/antitermination protein NusG [Anaerolineales bacterium]|jgi:transcriptional antiterminator RfaH